MICPDAALSGAGNQGGKSSGNACMATSHCFWRRLLAFLVEPHELKVTTSHRGVAIRSLEALTEPRSCRGFCDTRAERQNSYSFSMSFLSAFYSSARAGTRQEVTNNTFLLILRRSLGALTASDLPIRVWLACG